MENYFEKIRKDFFGKYSYSQSNIEFINAYCDAIRYNLNRCGIRKVDGEKIRTTKRTSNSFMVLYDVYLMFIITVMYDGNRIQFDTKMI
jgi:hypothetical protein